MSKNPVGIAVLRKYVVLLALSFAALVTQIEMGTFALFAQDIKASLRLSDTELGLVTGFGAWLTFAVIGIPMARRADRGNRVLLVAGCAALASVMMFLYGAVTNFWQLVLVRMGVGIGEAGGGPASLTLITSAFNREERPRAFSLYGLALPIGGAIGLVIGGWGGQYYGWRAVFMSFGVLGLSLAFLTWLLLVGRPCSGVESMPSTHSKVASVASPRFWQAVSILFKIQSYRNIVLSNSVMSFFSAGIAVWITPYFIRKFHLLTGVLGTWLAIAGIAGMIGGLMGGYIASRFASAKESLHLKVNAMSYTVSCALLIMVLLLKNPSAALILYVANSFVLGLCGAPLLSAILSSVPDEVRALSAAIRSFFAGIIGAGFGPLVAGGLSDLFHPWAGDQSLRYALLVLCPGYLWSAYHTWAASRTISKDLEAARAMDPGQGQKTIGDSPAGSVRQILAQPI